jgi:hypothetical protein
MPVERSRQLILAVSRSRRVVASTAIPSFASSASSRAEWLPATLPGAEVGPWFPPSAGKNPEALGAWSWQSGVPAGGNEQRRLFDTSPLQPQVQQPLTDLEAREGSEPATLATKIINTVAVGSMGAPSSKLEATACTSPLALPSDRVWGSAFCASSAPKALARRFRQASRIIGYGNRKCDPRRLGPSLQAREPVGSGARLERRGGQRIPTRVAARALAQIGARSCETAAGADSAARAEALIETRRSMASRAATRNRGTIVDTET